MLIAAHPSQSSSAVHSPRTRAAFDVCQIDRLILFGNRSDYSVFCLGGEIFARRAD